MNGFEVKFDGMDGLIKDMLSLSGAAENEIERAIKDTTAEAMRIIQQATPVGRTGAARGGWSMRFPSKLSGEVTTNSKVLWFLEWGTGLFGEGEGARRAKYKIAPVRAKALAFQWGKAEGLGLSTSIHKMGTDAKGRTLYRSKAGNATISKKNAADLVVRRFVMHPGIKPVAMVRGNLPRIRAIFEANVQAAADRVTEHFLRGF